MYLKCFYIVTLLIFHTNLLKSQDGKSLVLNGCTDFLEIAETDLLDYNDVLSIECWIAPNCDDSNKVIIGKEWCQGEMSYYLSVFDGKLFWRFSESGSCTSEISSFQSVNKVVPSGEFTHVAVVHDQSEVNLFVNGEKVDSEYTQGSFSGIFNSNEKFRIGAYKNIGENFGNYFSGLIDDIRVWSIALTEESIEANNSTQLTGNENGLILYLDMESASIGSDITLYNQANILDNLIAVSGGFTTITPFFISSLEYFLNPLNFEEEYTFCDDDLILNLGANSYKSIEWSTGSQNDSILINTSGTYSVIIETDLCKFHTDTFEILKLDMVFEEEDVYICSEDTYEFQGQILVPNTSEEFTLPSISGCDTLLTINIFELPDEKLSFLGTNIISCESSVTLISPYVSTIWSGGDIGNEFLVGEQGTYFAAATDSLGCTYIDSIEVSFELITDEISVIICEGDSLVINNETYNTSGSYQQILNSTTTCDTTLQIKLEVLENAMNEETYSIELGEILDINGIQYDSIGQYMQDLIASNGCDSILIINIILDEPLITFDFDDCAAIIQTMSNADYSEFTPYYNSGLDCGNVTASNIYREDPFENMHSCTEGLNDSYSMCISSDSNCEFDAASTKMVRMTIEITPNSDSEIVLTGLDFYQQAPETFDWINGADGPNNYPTKYGIRILKAGVEIYSNENIPTSLTWQKEEFSFINNADFVFTEATALEIQLLPYCPIGANSTVTAWDLEDLKIFGSCSTGDGSLKVIAGTVGQCANEILEGVQILIDNASETKQFVVDEYGEYVSLENLAGSYVKITAYKDDDHMKGVSTLDLMIIQRHLLGLQSFEDPLQYIASDINYDGKVSHTDLLPLRKLILGIYTELPSNNSYRFLNKRNAREENETAWDISENIEVQNLSNHIHDADFIPVKIGDVSNQNISYSSGTNASNYQKNESLHIEKQESNTASDYSLVFNIDRPMSVNGLHFSIDLNGSIFVGIETQLKGFTEDNYNLTDDGILHISWIDARNNESASAHLFTLNFEENNRNEYINEIIKSEVYVEDQIFNLEPENEFDQNVEESISNLIVYPNPVNVETILSFDSNKACNVNFSVHSLEGKLIYKDVHKSITGSNKIQIPQNVLHQNAGVLIIRMTNQETSLLEKIIITD